MDSIWVLLHVSRGRSDCVCPSPFRNKQIRPLGIARQALEASGHWAPPGSSLLPFVSSLGGGGWWSWTRDPPSRTPQGECFWREGKGAQVPARPGCKGAPGDGERLLIWCDWCTGWGGHGLPDVRPRTCSGTPDALGVCSGKPRRAGLCLHQKAGGRQWCVHLVPGAGGSGSSRVCWGLC